MSVAALTSLVRCIALPNNLDVAAIHRTPTHTEVVTQLLDSKSLWDEYGIDDDIIVQFLMSFYEKSLH